MEKPSGHWTWQASVKHKNYNSYRDAYLQPTLLHVLTITLPFCEAKATRSSSPQRRTHLSSSPGFYDVKMVNHISQIQDNPEVCYLEEIWTHERVYQAY